MTAERRDYVAYMLRLWRTRCDGEWVWRASLESPHSGERQAFANLKALFVFLRRQTAAALDGKEDKDESSERR